ncbi:LytTR family transcriptional regulator DNA-binding domain-containing protein [Klebsiella pneumoniae]|nr:LytTR family transcriptional regulator DNA-binding domain-containing protein [Klebsiella pneumoniae]
MPMNITEFCSKLPTAHFFRCHRSYCVNLSKIREVSRGSTTPMCCACVTEFQVPVSRSKVKEFRQLMNL